VYICALVLEKLWHIYERALGFFVYSMARSKPFKLNLSKGLIASDVYD
jgi:hypothetical protein